MRSAFVFSIFAIGGAMFASPVAAADLGSGFSVSGGATVVSDYRFRGISQTNRDFALQGTITLSHSSGFYATVWGSSIDDYIAGGSDQEIDLIGGFRHAFGGTTIDVGVLYYYYPGAEQIFPGYDSDFWEPYFSVTHSFGPLTAKATVNYAPRQNALSVGNGKEDNLYLGGDLSAGIPGTPVAVSAHLGHSFGPSYLTIGDAYTDWNVGVSYTTGPLTIGVTYVDTNRTARPVDHNIAGAGVVGSIGVSF